MQLVSLSRRDGGNAETLEELLRRLRELCRLMAYVSALEAAAANPDRDVVKRSADAHALLEAMFRRAADDLQHVARTMPGAIRFGAGAVLVGFTTHTGTVTAASEWDGPAHRKHVRPALPGSYERLFHEVNIPRFLVPLRTDPELRSVLSAPRLERAIGVIYAPETERRSHYFHARLADQFDYVLHFDETRAVEPLERTALWEAGEVAETFPSGL